VESAGSQFTGDEMPEPWTAEGLRSGSAHADHAGRGRHGFVGPWRPRRDPRAAGRNALASIPHEGVRVSGCQARRYGKTASTLVTMADTRY